VPPAAAEADLAAAQQAANEGADREAAARRRLEQAEDDFERAQRRGERAEARARDAGQAAAGAFGSGPAMPPIGAPGTTPVAFTNGGAAPVMASSTSDGGNPWYDIFVKPFNPWHDRTRYEMWRYVQEHAWGIPTAFIGSGMTYLSHHWMRMVPGAQLYAKVLGPDGVVRTLPHGYMHAHAVPDELARGQWASRARWLNRAGGALSFAGGFADQIVRDSGNPNLATDERIGRATVNGATIAAGALQGARWGAMAGSFIPIPGGTIIGGAVGAIVGGAIASGAVDYFNDGLVEIGGEIGDKVGDGIEKVGEGLDAAGEALEDAGGAVKDFFGF
jgi:hypothetical protein